MKYLKFLLFLFPLISLSQQKFDNLREQLIKDKTLGYEYVYAYENNYAVFRTFKGKMGLIDTLANVIIKPTYDYIDNKKELKNIFEVVKTINKKFKRGYIDLKGSVRIPLEYDDIYYLQKGLIRVSNNNKTGVLDTLNKTILPIKFESIMSQDGILFVENNNSIDLFDSKGKQLTNFQAKDIEYFTNKKSIATLQNNTTLILNNEGAVVLNTIKNHKFEKIIGSDSYIIRNTINNKKGVLNSSGKYEIECKYDDILPSNSIYIVKEKDKYGFVTKNDSTLKRLIYNSIYTVNYKDTSQFKNQYLAQKGDLKAIINPFIEKEVIPFQYQNIQAFSNYYITTNLDNKNSLFSENGELIVPEGYEFYNGFQNKIFAVKNSKNYLLTINNLNYSEVEIPVNEFVKKQYFSNGISESKYQIFKNENKFGVISNENKIVIPCEFSSIEQIYSTGEFIVQKNKKYGVVNAKNEELLEIKYDTFQPVKEVIKFEIKNQKTPKIYFINFYQNLDY
ncbi:WG repeat-containing protein [Flavobacterium sp. JLP]|uniref:WG repeat-containing protein n=1 Tax=Flavobacterium sp. JLP TaxID=2783793 RepID=UPI00188DA856|nr:WG repeat-containing protein [Flavobacterium sp. JLP]MBF4505570.1 WG repeat-containing protein [Flavobacterium sp. JLP]